MLKIAPGKVASYERLLYLLFPVFLLTNECNKEQIVCQNNFIYSTIVFGI
jgi:hypothetical protein